MAFLNNKKVVCFGDSWTGGHEIDERYDHGHPIQESVRKSGKYPEHLEKYTGTTVVNEGIPSLSNDTILRMCIEYVTDNYNKNDPAIDDLFIVVGWSSPCRKEVFLDYNGELDTLTLWPNLGSFGHECYPPPLFELHKLHMKYFWTDEEMFNRYVHHNLYLQNFLKSYGINFIAYNSFYEFPLSVCEDEDREYIPIKTVNKIAAFARKWKDEMFGDWNELGFDVIMNEHGNMGTLENYFDEDKVLWDNLIDAKTQYNKDDFSESFCKFLGEKIYDEEYFTEVHPTPKAHALWADELARVIENRYE